MKFNATRKSNVVKNQLTAGIDIGSNQVCCVAGVIDDEKRIVKILGSSIVPCSDGIKAGAVINIQEAKIAINKACAQAEIAASGQIVNAIVAIKGEFIKTYNKKGVTSIDDGEVTEDTIYNVLDNARDSVKPGDEYEVLQIVPREFILNQQKGIQNPIGMGGNQIEVDVQALVAPKSSISNILKATSDYCDDNRIYSHLAASDILVRKEEKELGCLVVDFGGFSIGLVQYVDGILKYTDEIPVGSENITRDLMLKLRASYPTAKRVKEQDGAAFVFPEFKNRKIEYLASDGVSMQEVDRLQLVESTIQPRIDQILYSIEDVLRKNSYTEQFLAGGIILTGGGSKLEYISKAFEKYFNCFVRPGIPLDDKVVGPNDIVLDPSYTAAIGAMYSLLSDADVDNSQKKSPFSKGIKGLFEKFEELF